MSNTGFAILRQGVLVVIRGARQRPLPFAASVFGSLVFAAATVGTAYALSAVTARIVAPAFRAGATRTSAVVAAVAIVLSVIAAKMAGIFVRRVAVGHLQYGLVAKSRLRLLKRYLMLPYEWLLRQSQGRLLSTVTSDADASWVAMADLPLAVGAVAICLLAGVALWLTDPVLAVVGVGAFPVLIGVNIIYSRAVTMPLTAAQRLRADVAAVAAENIDGAHVVRALGRADDEARRFAVACDALRAANVQVSRVRAIFNPLIEALPSFGSLALLLTGGIRMSSGAIGVEELISATLLFTAIAFPLGGLGWMLNQLPRGVVGWNRVGYVPEVLETNVASGARSVKRANEPMALDLNGVTYSYRPDQPVLHEVELLARPGHTIAITGPTGSGKSTLARLIVGLLPPSHGRVLLDGRSVPDITSADLVSSVAFVPQEPFLFADTVRSNLALDWAVTDDEMWDALRLANADAFVAALPGGLDELIGERGGTLSGGQRQRLALARAIVRRPRLLVLDDATSGLDPRVEERVIGSLASLNTTLVVIAHRPATLALAEEIILLDHGRVAARGSHARLLETSTDYSRLVRLRTEVTR